MIELNNISKIYNTGKIQYEALKNISLNIEKGEFTAIMGPSGSGKSTLMNILGCLDRYNSGKYKLNNRLINDLTDDELAKIRNIEIGFVFQNFNLLPRLNILENVELPMIYAGVSVKERNKRAISALEKVGLLPWIKHRPNEISGGQRQRVAIARAIVNNPSVIMADEPTGNLDSKVSLEVMKIFQNLNKEGTTIIMVTHEEEIARYTKRVVYVKDGEIFKDENIICKDI
ncbi:ABC transporter ATP-binding protein [Clostridium septicum]|uniref:ABC transporter ATP-binding protein n=1 Tax=Clostridium septicum TaxID=1504 RepID=A0A9N7JJJ2_CLOSE|nr:ABC transporter ATP-binding protein [Clostridium septicum]AYE33490.1 ABC transporter ATP-binding protein [Clostridium septicum]MDU1315324.1 ABC transporter ATP-binding protein [Clostridium septicum]QAS61661.1 ABC transporter ATP-binding protein [Clostridium septicum]UEC22276.1 ABC transporter ATP-binding protein [Clostridium septicum]USS02502.1 ABC transporter ATP-binding protein [Clostridium septicum]